MVDIRSEEELRRILEKIVTEVIESVSFDLLGILEEYIRLFVYGFEYFPNKLYYNGSGNPTYEFLRAWKLSAIKKEVGNVSQELFYDSSKMTFDSKTWKHGSFAGDARENLADILNVTGYTSSLMAPSGTRLLSKLRMPYWDLYCQLLFDRGKLRQMLETEFRKKGVVSN